MYRLRIPDHLVTFIRGLHPELKKKVREALRRIVSYPGEGKLLKEELGELRSFRVGRFRIVYRMAEGNEIQVVAVGPRARIYEETYRLLRKEISPEP